MTNSPHPKSIPISTAWPEVPWVEVPLAELGPVGDNGYGQAIDPVGGAGGFIGSWVVKELLLRGYAVRGTARDPSSQKNSHLQKLEGAKERLCLNYADVMDYDSLSVAFNGCEGVFHVASPVSVDPRLVPVAVEGTKNVINAAADMGVRRVVFTSTFGAVHMDPNRSHDTVVDESCWSNLEFCKQKDWYCYAKTVAEMVAAEQASKRGIQLVVVLPAMTLGQMLQSTINPSIRHIADFLNGSRKTHRNAVAGYVDARDVARAHALVYEDPKAHGRYLCIATEGAQQAGNLPVPEGCTDPVANNFDPTAMSNDSICLYTF
ncbi:hypothetical protein OsJ_28586 [Oryza sativa Japonica Group]|uniref:NAD-dependent epimerase/dehydratase domain-containing protein n=1 Tax=Oryza sativa subsp. japonica TaxID=39947 RepID=B9G2F7_ORYSJ|nr:hypothetical protein OsJ_28586 [Oryza sativa Japonica Group]